MRNSMSKAVWGVFFVLLGIALAGRAVGVFDFNLFFPGWWTLFIIVPSAIGLVNSENRAASVFGLGIGILLLCSVQGIIDWYTFPRLIIALIFIVIGCSFLFRRERKGHGDYRYYNDDQSSSDSYYDNTDNSDNTNQKDNGCYSESNNNQGTNHSGYNQYSSFLSSRNVQFIDEEFTGTAVTSVLGNVQLDLRNAYINDDVVIEATCVLGGVDVYVPNNVKVMAHCTPILGGVENKVVRPYPAADNIHTIFIKGICILGGIEIR